MVEGLNDWTGERMIPERSPSQVFWEHIYRYKFATKYALGKSVLDIASGEGYGTAALHMAGATNVIGIDISKDAIRHAIEKYGLDFRLGNVNERIELPDKYIDVIVSFETIEHIQEPEVFLRECRRVLVPNGKLIISTPNKEGHDKSSINIFHHHEYRKEEFISIINKYFTIEHFYTQTPIYAQWWSLRSFIAKKSVYIKIKGFWRFRQFIYRIFCPHVEETDVDWKYRESVLDLILDNKNRYEILNPYVVRHASDFGKEIPTYFIIVARA